MLLVEGIAVGLLFLAAAFFLFMEIRQDNWTQEGPEGL